MDRNGDGISTREWFHYYLYFLQQYFSIFFVFTVLYSPNASHVHFLLIRLLISFISFNRAVLISIFFQPSQEKSQKKGKSSSKSSCCIFFFGSIFLLGAIGGLLAYDTQRNDGVFEKSAAGKFLKDTGALPYVETAWTKTLSTSARGYQWAEVNVPIYANITYVTLKPYGLVLKDVSIIGLGMAKNGWEVTKGYVVEKTPVVVNFVSGIFSSC